MYIWLADTAEIWLRDCCCRLLPVLSAEEQAKAFCYMRETDRLCSIAGRLMVRAEAARVLGTASVKILLSDYGKPFFAAENAFQFNLSHSGGLVVMAVSDTPVGVDTERILPLAWQDIVETFSPQEQRMLHQAADPLVCFYRIWTVREAFSKAIGTGLPVFANEPVCFHYGSGQVRYQGKTLYFSTRQFSDCLVSVCTYQKESPEIRHLKESDLLQPLSGGFRETEKLS